MKPAIGQPVPEFSLPAVDFRGTQTTVSPASLRGKPFVLFVYPRDNTPGCTVEGCNFRDLWSEFNDLNVEILGLSRDSIRSHQNFIKKSELPYRLIADERRELIGGWGLIINAAMYGKDVTKTARFTYFVDAQSIVREIWEDVAPPGHAAQVLTFAREFTSETASEEMT
ncbi:peroxiredoxin Q/BCP [Abditibacterium utsteinense]|uniref:thioredoxin-dependent peroxiredoxin n=1 Tax=Abditibacterium utsteinense TaxID=1960156 RepID=A0A2S8SPX3_9BACT|nr:peroxiredoxin [Abditibacterium utsteinense]PQV62850.1 peroxiredoxin Q/BCP [Abditibacterium utsteinense]